MHWHDRVVWQEGMFLRAQHFQQQDRHAEHRLEARTAPLRPHPWGVTELALDRDVRQPHEGPSIGLLLCATKDNEVVEYALSRAMSPTLVAEYRTRLPDRRLLQAKLHEFYQQAIGEKRAVANEVKGPGAARSTRRPAKKAEGGKASRGKEREP